MKFNVTVQEVYEKRLTIEAGEWQEALMKAIKESDSGRIAIDYDEGCTECNVEVEGFPYQVVDKWTIDEVEKYVVESPQWRDAELTESEMRQAMFLMSKDSGSKGLSWGKLEAALKEVVKKR